MNKLIIVDGTDDQSIDFFIGKLYLSRSGVPVDFNFYYEHETDSVDHSTEDSILTFLSTVYPMRNEPAPTRIIKKFHPAFYARTKMHKNIDKSVFVKRIDKFLNDGFDTRVILLLQPGLDSYNNAYSGFVNNTDLKDIAIVKSTRLLHNMIVFPKLVSWINGEKQGRIVF
jgi:hypothetical protein